jgi:hypothetical protein
MDQWLLYDSYGRSGMKRESSPDSQELLRYFRELIQLVVVGLIGFNAVFVYLIASGEMQIFDTLITFSAAVYSAWLIPRRGVLGLGSIIDRKGYKTDEEFRDYINSFGRIGFTRISVTVCSLYLITLIAQIFTRMWWSEAEPAGALLGFLIGASTPPGACWLSVYIRIYYSARRHHDK